MPRLRSLALAAGLLYLVTHVTSVGAAIVYRLGADGGDVALVQLGIALEVALAIACVANGVVLLSVLRPYGPVGAAAFAGLRGLEAAIIGTGTLPMIVLVQLQTGAIPASVDPALEPALSWLHEASFLVGQGLVIAVNTLLVSWLLWRSRLVFPGIPLLGAIGGTLVLLSDLGQLFGIVGQSGGLAMILAVPVFGFELWFAGYMLFVGFRPESPERMIEPARDAAVSR
ncbi:DUF4386 domain-containing protein [Microbacter sp. GSS18]|nr:DUF4386 domain-containing protein [Microbacter sp. GSS18]